MIILSDHQTFSLQNYGGISRYHAELISGINESLSAQACLSVKFSNNIHLQECHIRVKSFLPNKSIKGRGKFIYYYNQLYSIKKLYESNFDVFHATYYDPYFLPFLKGKPFVVTFHDMIYEKFSEQYPGLAIDTKIVDNKKRLAEQASHIIAVSESTKRDVVKFLDVDPAKITVIYHGSSLPIQPAAVKFNCPPYLLYVGNRYMYKNFSGLLSAIHLLLMKYSIKLLCVGGGEFTTEENKFISSLKITEAVEQRAITDYSLPTFYQNALAFVFPSLYEGFGIPILEAFACGCPCIVSNLSALPEVAGNAALYIDPNSPDSIIQAIERLLTDVELRNALVVNGRERLSNFSWQRTVAETINVYRDVT